MLIDIGLSSQLASSFCYSTTSQRKVRSEVPFGYTSYVHNLVRRSGSPTACEMTNRTALIAG